MGSNDETIHQVVKERYGAIARSMDTSIASQSCCGPSSDAQACECAAPLYDASLLEGLPLDVTGLSLGCGDPVTIATLKPGETVVDLGSGGGIDCFLASKQVGPAGRVIGVDMTPEMLAKANSNKLTMGVTNVEFRQGQIESLPVDSNSVDVVMSNCVINLSPDKAEVFAESFRVLKPGGRIAISDIVKEGDVSLEMRARLVEWAECVTGAIDAEQYIGMMRDAGFGNIQVVDKIDADDIVGRLPGMPRVFSARITATKPTS